MKKFDIQIIQVSMYPKKMDIHVSKYPCIQVCMISKYPIIQVSKKNQYPRYPCIRIYEKSGIHSSLPIYGGKMVDIYGVTDVLVSGKASQLFSKPKYYWRLASVRFEKGAG